MVWLGGVVGSGLVVWLVVWLVVDCGESVVDW